MNIRRFRSLLACLLAVMALLAPAASLTSAQPRLPALVAANLIAPQGTVAITGAGFTPGGVVRIVIHDLWNAGPTVEHWVVSSTGDLDESVAYLTAGLYGEGGSERTASTVLTPITIYYMPPSDIDPAQGYASSTVVWAGGCPDLVVQAWDAETDTWSDQLGIDLAGC